MKLTGAEKARVAYLLGKQEFGGGLAPWEQEELRQLLANVDPEAVKWGLFKLVAFGLGLVAAWALLRERGNNGVG